MRRLFPWLLTAGLVVMILAALAEVASRQTEDEEPTPRAIPTARPSPSPVTTPRATALLPGATTPLGSPPVGPATTLRPAQATTPPTIAPITPRPAIPTPSPLLAVPSPAAPGVSGTASGRTADTGGGAFTGALWALGTAALLRRLARI